MRARTLTVSLLSSLAGVAALALVAGGAGAVSIPKIPKAPKVVEYPVTIDVAGYLEYKWTVDGRSKCSPGYAKTIDEELSFELGKPRASKIAVVGGDVVMTPKTGGQAKLRATVSGFQTTNYCPPSQPVEIPKPECKNLSGRLGVALSPLAKTAEEGGLVPLGQETLVTLWRTGGQAQSRSCLTDRPDIEAEREEDGFKLDPYGGIVVTSGISNTELFKLKPGHREVGRTKISGGCRLAHAHASFVAANVTSCTLEGSIVTIVKRTG
ncbi:MAG: hypothetical protein U0R71_14295 [Solirubrobacterales bacterium]